MHSFQKWMPRPPTFPRAKIKFATLCKIEFFASGCQRLQKGERVIEKNCRLWFTLKSWDIFKQSNQSGQDMNQSLFCSPLTSMRTFENSGFAIFWQRSGKVRNVYEWEKNLLFTPPSLYALNILGDRILKQFTVQLSQGLFFCFFSRSDFTVRKPWASRTAFGWSEGRRPGLAESGSSKTCSSTEPTRPTARLKTKLTNPLGNCRHYQVDFQ